MFIWQETSELTSLQDDVWSQRGGRKGGWMDPPTCPPAHPALHWSSVVGFVHHLLGSRVKEKPPNWCTSPVYISLKLQPRAPAAPVAGLGAAGVGRPREGRERHRGTGGWIFNEGYSSERGPGAWVPHTPVRSDEHRGWARWCTIIINKQS